MACRQLGGSCQWDVKLKTCRDHQRTAVLRDNGRGRAHATRAAPIRPGLAGACVHQTNERVARRHLARNGALSSLAPPILIQAWHRAIHTDLQHLGLGLLVAHIPHLPSPFPPVSFIGIADIHPSLPHVYPAAVARRVAEARRPTSYLCPSTSLLPLSVRSFLPATARLTTRQLTSTIT